MLKYSILRYATQWQCHFNMTYVAPTPTKYATNRTIPPPTLQFSRSSTTTRHGRTYNSGPFQLCLSLQCATTFDQIGGSCIALLLSVLLWSIGMHVPCVARRCSGSRTMGSLKGYGRIWKRCQGCGPRVAVLHARYRYSKFLYHARSRKCGEGRWIEIDVTDWFGKMHWGRTVGPIRSCEVIGFVGTPLGEYLLIFVLRWTFPDLDLGVFYHSCRMWRIGNVVERERFFLWHDLEGHWYSQRGGTSIRPPILPFLETWIKEKHVTFCAHGWRWILFGNPRDILIHCGSFIEYQILFS